jgi:phospholipid/cholesterol/gamma-HCH transport system substrate-binding protein
MSRRRREQSFLRSPVLIGALTTLVVIVAVVLAYKANTGLPFVPTYDLHVQMKDASELQKGDDVNEGGALVGLITSITATRDRAGTPVADVTLALHKNVEPLPADTRFTTRLKGSIGVKYLQISPGRSRRGLRNGATVPVSQTGATTDLDQVLNMFTPPTRKGVQQSTIGFGEAVAGRGFDLNRAIGKFLPLVSNLLPVATNLASPSTDLAGFFRGLEQFSSALAPVAQTQASLFKNLNTTFSALAGVAPSLQDTISRTPPAFESVISQSPIIRPFLTDTASLLTQFEPGIKTLRTSAPVLTDVFRTGVQNLPATIPFDRRLVSFSNTLGRVSNKPAVLEGVNSLSYTTKQLQQPLAFLTPVQSTCNYVTLFLRNIADAMTEHVGNAGFLDVLPLTIRDSPGPNLNYESQPSSKPYTGGASFTPGIGSVGPLHSDPYPNTASPGEVRECSAGNEPYQSSKGALVGNPTTNVGIGTQKTTRGGSS